MGKRIVVILQILVVLISILLTRFLDMNYQSSLLTRVFSESIIVYMPVAVFGVYLVAYDEGSINRILKKRFLTRIGELSMYSFLIHYLVLQYVHMITTNLFYNNNISNITVCVIAMIITAVLTYIYIFGEKYLNKSKII